MVAQVGVILVPKFEKFAKNLQGLNLIKLFFIIISTSLCVILASGAYMSSVSPKIHEPFVEMIVVAKLLLLLFFAVNLLYMVAKFVGAKRAFLRDEQILFEENLILITVYFTPLNLVLTLMATYLGLAFRVF